MPCHSDDAADSLVALHFRWAEYITWWLMIPATLNDFQAVIPLMTRASTYKLGISAEPKCWNRLFLSRRILSQKPSQNLVMEVLSMPLYTWTQISASGLGQ